MATVRAAWQAVESSGKADQVKLKKVISDTVNWLKDQIDGKLRTRNVVVSPSERLLFDEPLEKRTLTRK